ncbi:hypothetical protein T492DRAFT_201927 [Pavlovales sp. CCMP2436]|nr:hypothetical protein T492DRAFT_201927 [Pavlovales sp. CCMP2436]
MTILPQSPWVRRYVWLLTRHHLKLFFAALAMILGITCVSVGQFGFMIRQSEVSSYDWTVSSTQQSIDVDALEYARTNRGIDAPSRRRRLGTGDVYEERTQQKDFLTVVYQHKGLNSTANIITPGNLRTICETENQLLGHPDYRNICFRGASQVGYTRDTGSHCAKQMLSIASLYYLAWTAHADYMDKDNVDYAFGSLDNDGLAFLQMFKGIPVLDGVPADAPTDTSKLWDGHKRVCDTLSDAYVKERTDALINMIDDTDFAKTTLGFFFSADVEKRKLTDITRSNLIVTGGPVSDWNYYS